MRAVSDLDVNRNVRRVLIKHWIDLGRVSIRTVRGHVMVYGSLQRVPGVRDPVSKPIVEKIFYEIKRVEGVYAITARMENWTYENGNWRPTTDAERNKTSSSDQSIGSAGE